MFVNINKLGVDLAEFLNRDMWLKKDGYPIEVAVDLTDAKDRSRGMDKSVHEVRYHPFYLL